MADIMGGGKRIFVTGATGFLGKWFLESSKSYKDLEVIAFSRTSKKVTESVTDAECNVCSWYHAPSFYEVNGSIFEDVDVFMHFASAGVSPKMAAVDELIKVNVLQSQYLWNLAIDHGVKKFVICGSCFEYGQSSEKFDFIPPSAVLAPIENYGMSKAAATIAAITTAKQRGVAVDIVRPFHLYGNGQDSCNFWPQLIKAAESGADFKMSSGEQVRAYTHVSVVADEFLSICLEDNLEKGFARIRNAGENRAMSLREFAFQWWNISGAQGRLLIGALPSRVNEIARLVPEIGSSVIF